MALAESSDGARDETVSVERSACTGLSTRSSPRRRYVVLSCFADVGVCVCV